METDREERRVGQEKLQQEMKAWREEICLIGFETKDT
jgi:hypothetical protein